MIKENRHLFHQYNIIKLYLVQYDGFISNLNGIVVALMTMKEEKKRPQRATQ